MSYVTVRVWVSRVRKVSPGHAALAIFPGSRTVGDGYISFAPVKSGSVYGPGKFYPLEHDLEEYQNCTDDPARGCWVGKIYGLNPHKMFDSLRRHTKHAQVYSLFNECATQVHRYLKIGGGDTHAGLWARNALVCWSPDDVEDYARSIVNHTRHLGSSAEKIVGAGTL